MYKHLLVPVDGSDASQAAIQSAVALAKGLGAKISVYHAMEVIEPYYVGDGFVIDGEVLRVLEERICAESSKLLDRAKALADSSGVDCETLMERPPNIAAGIIDAAQKQGCDLIVMGSHGHGAVAAAFLGSVTQKILHNAKLPVLVIR